MKKFVLSLFLFALMLIQNVQAMTFDEAVSLEKPAAILIYATWADDYASMMTSFNTMAQKYAEQYNFVTVNIATEEAKGFNKKYHIYPNLPYVLLFRSNGKVSRYLQKNCVLDSSCFDERLKFFLNK